jgi:hypothetical protein
MTYRTVAATVVLLILSACGGNDGQDQQASPTTATVPVETTAATTTTATTKPPTAIAAIPDAKRVIHGCRDDDKSGDSGDLRVLDSKAGQVCGSRETALAWNQTGPQGPAGPAGPLGPAGADGVSGYEIVQATGQTGFTATVTCPSGKKAIAGGYRWTGLTLAPISHFHPVSSHPTADGTDWTVAYDRAVEAEGLAERPHRDRVGNAGHPTVDRVEGRGGDHDGVGLGHGLGLVGLPPPVADGEAGDGAKQRRVDERQRLRGGR